MSKLPTPRDAHERQILADIESIGWHVVQVPKDERTPGWCFSIGLQHSYEHPELLVFGLPLETGHQIINRGADRIKRGSSIETNRPCDVFLEGYECILRPVLARWQEPFLGSALWFYGSREMGAHQVFWPDREGAMPWDAEAPVWLRSNQPLLYESTVEKARVVALLASLEGV